MLKQQEQQQRERERISRPPETGLADGLLQERLGATDLFRCAFDGDDAIAAARARRNRLIVDHDVRVRRLSYLLDLGAARTDDRADELIRESDLRRATTAIRTSMTQRTMHSRVSK